MPATGAGDLQFRYTIDDGKGLSADAPVSIQVRAAAANESPTVRYRFQQRSFTVGAGGTLDLPVLDDWRDFDGDPLVIASAEVSGAAKGTVTVAPSGRLKFVAPATGGAETISYTVSDGTGDGVVRKIPVTVLGPTSTESAPPLAQPDIARGQVGQPITVEPLANDLPGADPADPNAELALAGTVASPAGTRVDTDLTTGELTVVASRPGTYKLSYTAAYGNAKFSNAPIRIDVARPPSSAQAPVAVPDTGVLYGQNPATVDVLANDFDPAGGVLVVQRAVAVDDTQLQVSVLSGRFLRVRGLRPDLDVNPQVVRYTITNGTTAPVTGELTVTQVSPPADDTPLAVDNYATVRSGDSARIPVLDNDIDPAGAALGLLDDLEKAPAPGALPVTGPEGSTADPGNAFVSDNQVRFRTPTVRTTTTITVGYVARNPAGERAAGTLHVTVAPPPSARNPDQAPKAGPLDSRAISGQTIRIRVPTTGIDADGDTANVVGIASAPHLGRVVSVGSSSISYEAFPTVSGTDRFDYIVSDPYGKTSQSTISVGVAPVSEPQPPTAVDDTVTAAPGSKVRVDALANDVVAPNDVVRIGDLAKLNPDLSRQVRRLKPAGPVLVTASPTDGKSVQLLYSVTDGAGDPSIGTITVRSQRGYVPPPIVSDVSAAPPPGARTVTVDVLGRARDPQNLALTVAKVYDTRAVTGADGRVTVPVVGRVQNIVYSVANSQGGVAAAVIHVPAAGRGLPYLRADQLITLGRDAARIIDIRDYVIDPAGRQLRLTTTDTLSTAPGTGLRLTATDTTHLRIQGANGYNGPGAISFEVIERTATGRPQGQRAIITIPVQVGPDTPVIRCPSAPIRIVEGGPDRSLDIASLCHVWLSDRSQLADVDYTATWTTQPKDVSIFNNGTPVIGLRAAATPCRARPARCASPPPGRRPRRRRSTSPCSSWGRRAWPRSRSTVSRPARR